MPSVGSAATDIRAVRLPPHGGSLAPPIISENAMTTRRNFIAAAAANAALVLPARAHASARAEVPDRAAQLLAVTFESQGVPLFARLFLPTAAVRKQAILLLHGFPGVELNFDIAHALCRRGFKVMIPHYRGSWGMAGNYSFGGVLEDAAAAARFLAEHDDGVNPLPSSLCVMGHSLGGFAALQVALLDRRVQQAVSFAGFNFAGFARSAREQATTAEQVAESWGSAMLPLSGVTSLQLAKEALNPPRSWDVAARVREFHSKRLLLLAANRDQVAPVEGHHVPLVAALRRAGQNVTAETFDAGHDFASVRLKLTGAICDWVS
jgi:dipeptidyl aminopeptidase/acylaminoacyl peptidase